MLSARSTADRRLVRRNRIFAFVAAFVLCSSLGSLAIAADVDEQRRGTPTQAEPSKDAATKTPNQAGESPREMKSRVEPTEPTPTPPSVPSPSPSPDPPPVAPVPDPLAPDCAAASCVALTFDDGPGPDTGRLLDTLAAKGVHATFFVLGGAAGAHPQLVAREVNEGHAVGNHTWDHRDLTKLTDAEVDWEVNQTRDTITAASGFTPTMVRPPYGATDDRVAGRLACLGDSMVLWDVDSQDWKNKDDAAAATQHVLDTVKPGSIVLLHDIHPWTVDAVPGLIDELRARGYTLVTVPELLGGTPAAGTTHFSR